MSKKVLIVDDDKLIREQLAVVLEEKGLEIDTAPNGKEGLKKALAGGIDLVVSDIRMPELDGLQMVKKIREDENGKNLPIVILSVDEAATSINQALASGVTVYLTKANISPEDIAEQILTALQ